MRRAREILVTMFAASVWLGCGGTSRPSSSASAPRGPTAEKVWQSKCGSCHVPVEPGTRSREDVEAAMTRHRARLTLTNDQWSSLVEFLAPRSSSSR